MSEYEFKRPSKGRWFVLAIVALPLLGLSSFFWLNDRHEQAVANGHRAVAKVLRLEEGFCWFGTKQSECLSLTLEVHPSDGASFEARIDHDVPNMYLPRVQAGSLLYVTVHPVKKRDVYLDVKALAEAAPTALDAASAGEAGQLGITE
jgi:hypothetical protein